MTSTEFSKHVATGKCRPLSRIQDERKKELSTGVLQRERVMVRNIGYHYSLAKSGMADL